MNKIIILVCAAIILVCGSCFKRPEAAFSYQPLENPEAGEKINFTNESLEALYYYWDFGNGVISEEENPSIKYEKPGDYRITLVAENKFRSDSISQTILINPPTILDVYCFGSDASRLVSAWVRVWNSYGNAERGDAPVQTDISNEYGQVRFTNLGAKTYYVYIKKTVEGGAYEGGGNVGPLVLNEINIYGAAVYFHYDKKSKLSDQSASREHDTVFFKRLEEEHSQQQKQFGL